MHQEFWSIMLNVREHDPPDSQEAESDTAGTKGLNSFIDIYAQIWIGFLWGRYQFLALWYKQESTNQNASPCGLTVRKVSWENAFKDCISPLSKASVFTLGINPLTNYLLSKTRKYNTIKFASLLQYFTWTPRFPGFDCHNLNLWP